MPVNQSIKYQMKNLLEFITFFIEALSPGQVHNTYWSVITCKFAGICVNMSSFVTENIFPAVLSLYKEGGAQNLPDGNEVLVCTSTTTAEEVKTWRLLYSVLKLNIFRPCC